MERKLLWNDSNIEVVKVQDKWYALNGWNGERYLHCWETDEQTFATNNEQEYELQPIYAEDADGNFEIVDYKII